MGTKIKGIYKGFKFISQIFVVKEREMEIGYPTDVKHVAHIGWDGSSGTAPSWMNEFKTTSDFAATSLGSFDAEGRDSNSNALSTWSSQDFEQSMGGRQAAQVFKDSPVPDIPDVPKKHKRRKSKLSSSPRSSSSSKHTRGSKSKGSTTEIEVIHGMQLRMC